jgi:flagellar assembly factor FliW
MMLSDNVVPVTCEPHDMSVSRKIVIENRYGRIEFDPDETLLLPQGLLGFSDYHEFGLTSLKDARLSRFKLLQCLAEQDLSFLLLPLNLESGQIDAQDIDEVCANLSLAKEDAAFLLIVSVRPAENGISVSVNLRAPLVVDVRKRIARQYVIPNIKYDIRHQL